MAYAHLRGRRVARSGEADKSSAKRYLSSLWQRVPDHCRHRLSGSGRIGAESLAHPSRHHEGDERKDTTSPFQRAEYRKGTPGTGVSTVYAGGRNKADVRMVNNAGADGSRFDYSNSGSASPFSLRYTRTISRITSPYFSTPFFRNTECVQAWPYPKEADC